MAKKRNEWIAVRRSAYWMGRVLDVADERHIKLWEENVDILADFFSPSARLHNWSGQAYSEGLIGYMLDTANALTIKTSGGLSGRSEHDTLEWLGLIARLTRLPSDCESLQELTLGVLKSCPQCVFSAMSIETHELRDEITFSE